MKRRIYQYVRKTESLLDRQDSGSSIPYLRLFGDLADLRSRYKIKRVLAGKLLLCSDVFVEGGTDVVIKTLQKSPSIGNVRTAGRSILSIGVPNMCRLLRYYETEVMKSLCLFILTNTLQIQVLCRPHQ